MSSGSWLNRDFGADDEESDNDFNPGNPGGSDKEDGSDREDAQPTNRKGEGRNGGDADDRNAKQRNVVNGKSSSRGSDRFANDNGEEDDGDNDNGEDDEGEGEDLDGNDDDEDEEEDEEDEDDEDAVRSRPRKRRRRGLNQFFEEEAEVDEEDDDLEAEEEEGGQEFIQDTHPDDDLPPEADHDDRRHRELDRQRQMEASMDAEKQAAALKERYGRRTTTALSSGSLVPQNLLMPSVDDPSLWGIKCKPGKERDIVARINKKMFETRGTRSQLKILSVFERGGGSMAGYIFVEARKKSDVETDLTNIPDVYPRGRTNLVPVKEMPDLLRVTKSKPLEIGGYVRIKRGLYTGDLGMIDDLQDNGTDVTVRLVPRLDYGLNEDEQSRAAAGIGPDGKRKRPIPFAPVNHTANRPPQRLFNENEAKKRHHKYLAQNRNLTSNSWTYKNDIYEDGFLIKDFKVNHLQTDSVSPKLDEITSLTKRDAEGAETLDLEALKHSIASTTADGIYLPGDDVEVYDGEQRGIVGKVEAVTGNIISIKVSEGELAGQIVEVPVKGVRKRFREGDHVKVIGSSRYRDEVGMVIRLKDDKVTVLTDTSMQEITVFSKDLREVAESGGASTQANKFDVQDLVQVDATTVGIIIKADRESVQVLDQNGSMATRLPSQVQKLEVRKNAVATDKNGSEIHHGDVVRESGGEGKNGTILHIHRGFVFAHNRTQIEHAGLWVARCMNVITTAAKGGRITQPSADLSKLNPALQQQMRNGGNGQPMAPPQRPGRDKLQGHQVQIRKGPYKGHRGIVKDTTATVARVELQSKNKTVNIEKQDVMVIDRQSGKLTDYHSFMGARFPPGMRAGPGGASGSRVPGADTGGFGGGRTPMAVQDGGRTPAWGSSSRTPAWGGSSSSGGFTSSAQTPTWKAPSGSQTSYGGAGGTTSYGGAGNYATNTGGANAGGRTPAWSSSARTPYGTDHGFSGSGSSAFDAFASGSRTPAYGGGGSSNSSRTPAWGGPSQHVASAPTPAASAPTPGFSGGDDAYTPYGSAPTPAAGGGRLDAPTPGPSNGEMSASTPYGGGYDAPTPAAGGGPRYVEDDDDD